MHAAELEASMVPVLISLNRVVNGQKLYTKKALHILSFEVCVWEQVTEQMLNSILDFYFKKNLICFSGAG